MMLDRPPVHVALGPRVKHGDDEGWLVGGFPL